MKQIAAIGVTLVLTACAVGPDFQRPDAPKMAGYTAKPLAETTNSAEIAGGHSQYFAAGQDIPELWWSLFHSNALDQLVKQALAGNPSLDAARAALVQARELSKAQYASVFPGISGGLAQTRAKNPSLSLASPVQAANPYYSIYTAQLSVSYAPDVFGANRRANEAAAAGAEASRFQYEATYLTLTSSVVMNAITEAGLRAQITATQRSLAIAHDLTTKLEGQRAIGTASQLDLLAQKSAEAQIAATLPPLMKQLAFNRDALTALLGRASAEEPAESFTLADFTLPERLPVSLPSRLVEQRPDVRQAEEIMHQASAQVGVAITDMLPQFAITGGIGSTANKVGDLFTPGNGFWSIGSSLSQTLFDAGALLHRRRAADAALDQAGALYRATVIAALQNVADALQALHADAELLQAAAASRQAAKESWDLTRQHYQLGGISLVALLNAEQTYLQAEIALATAQSGRLADSAALFQALGGGWWNRPQEGSKS